MHHARLVPAQASPVTRDNPRDIPQDIRGTRQAIFYLLRRPTGQPGQPMAPQTRAPRAQAALTTDADHFVFQF